jgi:DNA-directed RNA polymerase specialized sigma24 family protein
MIPYPMGTQLTKEQQQDLISRARAGEPLMPLRDTLILSANIQCAVERMAVRYHRIAQEWGDASVEREDLVNEAHKLMLSCFSRTLLKEDPIPYLLKIAKYAMINYVAGRTTSERRIHESLMRLDTRLEDIRTSTLADTLAAETRLPTPEAERLAEVISQAVQALPEEKRIVIERHYGINGHAPESLNKICPSLARKPRAGTRAMNAYYHHRQALEALRVSLGTTFSQYRVGGVQ